MEHHTLNPDSMLFNSFRHSQGDVGVQARIFRYCDLKWGLQPNLDMSEEVIERYVKFLKGYANKHVSHVKTSTGNGGSLESEFTKTISAILDFITAPDHASFNDASLPLTIRRMATDIIAQEARILNTASPWQITENGTVVEAHTEGRIATRVRGGRSSFLYLYGRDMRSTGFAEFDQMYADVWEYASSPNCVNQLLEHNKIVAEREMNILGRLCLAKG